MKKIAGAALFLLLAGGGYAAAVHLSGGAFYDFGLPLGGDLGELRRTTLAFWEDLQFKDFDKAATYHAPDRQDEVDIPFLIERLFVVKPEALDIMEIVMADLDSSGLRARIKTRVKARDLITEGVREREIMLYFQRDSLESPWYMELESSLRGDEAEEGKKH